MKVEHSWQPCSTWRNASPAEKSNGRICGCAGHQQHSARKATAVAVHHISKNISREETRIKSAVVGGTSRHAVVAPVEMTMGYNGKHFGANGSSDWKPPPMRMRPRPRGTLSDSLLEWEGRGSDGFRCTRPNCAPVTLSEPQRDKKSDNEGAGWGHKSQGRSMRENVEICEFRTAQVEGTEGHKISRLSAISHFRAVYCNLVALFLGCPFRVPVGALCCKCATVILCTVTAEQQPSMELYICTRWKKWCLQEEAEKGVTECNQQMHMNPHSVCVIRHTRWTNTNSSVRCQR